MPEKILVGNFSKGLREDRLPFVIDNDSFPVMINSYSWRGRIKRKRGTSLLGRLQATVDIGPPSPPLPVMGLEDYLPAGTTYPLLIAFDTKYSYQINQSGATPFFYSVSFYKATGNPVEWSGTDAQQFWSTNYEGAFWETNGKPGFHYLTAMYTSGSPGTTITFNLKNGASNFTTLIVGDVLWFNQFGGGSTINLVSGVVSDVSGAAGGNYVVTFSASVTVSGSGIAQMLTNSLPMQDGIRWYDGDPTGGTGTWSSGATGWVNFAPPVTLGSFGFDDYTSNQYYLVGATAILPFKDRLLFFGPYIQATNQTSATQLIDTVLWSWNGTPYYTVDASGNPVLTPTTGTANVVYGADPTAYQVNVTGKGGYLAAGISQPIVTVTNNEDVLLIGFTGRQTRFVYTGNDLSPFLFYSINSEIGSSATFSGITLDRGALTIGQYGLALTSQTNTQRIDLEIPDEIFNIAATNQGAARVNAARDFYREWIYFTYPYDGSNWKYPTQTLIYNYRDNTWGIFYENYTTHGSFRKITNGLTWATVGSIYPTWESWDQPWNSSITDIDFPSVCAGNQQGFVMLLDQGTAEGPSGWINTITVLNPLELQINSPNHCLMDGGANIVVGDYLLLSNMTGATVLNGKIASVGIIYSAGVADPDNFTLTFSSPHGYTAGYMTASGLFARLSQPFFQTKQFPSFWNDGRSVRLGVQKYLLDNTANGQITLYIYLSTDPDDPWNNGPIVPALGSVNNSLVYSTYLSTAPEPDLYGNNIQNPISQNQFQIWHRINTSLIGNTVQLGFNLDDTQMRSIDTATAEIALHSFILEVSPGPQLA